MRWNYYKLRQLSLLHSAMNLLQIATGITECDDYYKLRQYRPLERGCGKFILRQYYEKAQL